MDEIDSISLDDLQELYGKIFLWYSKMLKKRKFIFESINVMTVILILVGTIVGLITHNDIILGIFNSFGILISSFLKLKKYQKKINFLELICDRY